MHNEIEHQRIETKEWKSKKKKYLMAKRAIFTPIETKQRLLLADIHLPTVKNRPSHLK